MFNNKLFSISAIISSFVGYVISFSVCWQCNVPLHTLDLCTMPFVLSAFAFIFVSFKLSPAKSNKHRGSVSNLRRINAVAGNAA